MKGENHQSCPSLPSQIPSGQYRNKWPLSFSKRIFSKDQAVYVRQRFNYQQTTRKPKECQFGASSFSQQIFPFKNWNSRFSLHCDWFFTNILQESLVYSDSCLCSYIFCEWACTSLKCLSFYYISNNFLALKSTHESLKSTYII